jgi:hypothetical protein
LSPAGVDLEAVPGFGVDPAARTTFWK